MKKKIIMVLAGSLWQVPIVKRIKSMGHKTLVVNLYEYSPAFAYADYSEIADVLDAEKCLSIAKKYNIDAVLTEQSDIPMPTIAYVGEKLNLPTLGMMCAHLFTNKFMMREYCKKYNFPSPTYKLCKSVEDAISFFEKNDKKKIIIKPLDSNSSRGVFTILSLSDIEKYFEKTLSFSHIEKAVLAEQYVEGTEFTIDGIMLNGKHYSLAISEKKHYKHNPNIAYQLYFSHYNEKFDYDKLRNVNDKIYEASKLPNGCLTHVEYKYENGEFVLIEMAARGGGNLMSSEIVPLMSGVDNYSYLINSSLGLLKYVDISYEKILKKVRCAVLYFFDVPNKEGVVEAIEGLDFLENNNSIVQYKLNFSIGDYLKKAEDDSKRIGFYIAYADDKEQLNKLINSINEKVKFIIK